MGFSRVDAKDSSSSLASSMLGLGMEAWVCLWIDIMVRGRGSSTAGNSCCGGTFKFLQVLCILQSLLSPIGLSFLCE